MGALKYLLLFVFSRFLWRIILTLEVYAQRLVEVKFVFNLMLGAFST
jgi:hypothetical protein